jgi:hypothetical protein
MSYEHIKMDLAENGLATLTLCREPLNVLNIAMMKEINQALDSLKDEPLKRFWSTPKARRFQRRRGRGRAPGRPGE